MWVLQLVVDKRYLNFCGSLESRKNILTTDVGRFSVSKLLSDSCEFSLTNTLRSAAGTSAVRLTSSLAIGVDSFESLDNFDNDVGVSTKFKIVKKNRSSYS